MSDRILILGLGSIGQRHARNALTLGCEVVGYDPIPRPEIILDLGQVFQWVESIEEGLSFEPLGVIVATPPDIHCEGTEEARLACVPCLVEKPITDFLPDAERMVKSFDHSRIPLFVGYQFHFHPSLRRLKAQADMGEFGTIYAAHAEFASQQWCSHTYKADLLLECSHELDLLRWFLGEPQSVTAWGFSGREMRAGTIAFFRGSQATFHLDGLAPGYRRRLTLYGTKGVGEWTLDKAENDQAYVDELAEFLRVCRGEQAVPSCTGRDGWWAVRMVEAIRKSGESGRWEEI